MLPADADPAPEGVPELRLGAGSLVDLPAVAAHLAGKVVLMEGGPSPPGGWWRWAWSTNSSTPSHRWSSAASPHGWPAARPARPVPWALMHVCVTKLVSCSSFREDDVDDQGGFDMGRKYKIISGDGHLETPPDFVKFVPEKCKDRAPRLITLPDGGGDAWMMEGMPLTYASQNLKGRGKVKFAGQSYFNDDGSRADGAGDGVQRLREQDEDGIDAEILFAPVFASRFIEKIPDRDVVHVDGPGLQHLAGGRLLPPRARPPDRERADAGQRDRRRDQRAGTRDQLGFKTVQLVQYPNGSGAPKPEDDRFWERSLELGMALSPHFSFGGTINIGGPRHDTSQWPAEAGMTQHADSPPAGTMAQMIMHGVFDRIPELRFYFAEINAALFPAMLYYMDRDYLEYNAWFQLELPQMPSEYMRKHALLRHGARAARGQDGRGAARGHAARPVLVGQRLPALGRHVPALAGVHRGGVRGLDDDLRRTILVGNAAEAPRARPRRRHHGNPRGCIAPRQFGVGRADSPNVWAAPCGGQVGSNASGWGLARRRGFRSGFCRLPADPTEPDDGQAGPAPEAPNPRCRATSIYWSALSARSWARISATSPGRNHIGKWSPGISMTSVARDAKSARRSLLISLSSQEMNVEGTDRHATTLFSTVDAAARWGRSPSTNS